MMAFERPLMTITKQTLRHKREAILEIARRHGAHDVRLFGSVAREESIESSDVDILVRFEPSRSLFDHGGLISDLEDLLGVKVDVVSEGGMREQFRTRVLNEAIPL
jgi:predicted nucleotidyltransferase